MSQKRPAPETSDEESFTASQSPQFKTPRLDNVEEQHLSFEGSQSFFVDAIPDDMLGDLGLGFENMLEEPPLSVLQDFHSNGSCRETFDPYLKFSPVKDDEEEVAFADNKPPSEDIDCGEIVNFEEHLQDDASPRTSVPGPKALQSSQSADSSPSTAFNTFVPTGAGPGLNGLRLRPYKTFFHLSEMLEAKMSTFRHSDHTVFELFARVTYASRENDRCVQYFQFRDLFEELPPFLTGLLSG